MEQNTGWSGKTTNPSAPKALIRGRVSSMPTYTPKPSFTSAQNVQPIAPKNTLSPMVDYSGGGGGGGAYGGGGGVAPAAPAAPAAPSQKDWVAGDGAYKQQQASLDRALADYRLNDTADLSRYDSDYSQGVKRLGYGEAVADDPSTPQNEAMAGQWNLEDPTMASGRAFQNQQNDFAGRGMLQSSGYAEANTGLMQQLQQQYDGMAKGKADFHDEHTRGLTAFKGETDDAKKAAMTEAISRYAALYGQL